jgi:hypothetical protein
MQYILYNGQVHLWFRKKEENTPLDHCYSTHTVRNSSKEYCIHKGRLVF